MSKVISISNQKGGVGKTVTAVNLSVCLAELGKKVLLIDSDPQSNVATALGMEIDSEYTLAQLMLAVLDNREISDIGRYIYETNGINIIPSTLELAGAASTMISKYAREKALTRILMNIKQEYDYIIIDTKPDVDLLTMNALTASDGIIIPIKADDIFSLQGIMGIMSCVDNINNERKMYGQPELEIMGGVITMLDNRTKLGREISSILTSGDFNIELFNTKIPVSTTIAQASASQLALMDFDKNGKACQAYRDLAKEIVEFA